MLDPSDIPDKKVREWYLHSLSSSASTNKHSADKYPIIVNKYPTFLEIESTARCNVNPPCPMCNRVHRAKSGTRESDLPWFIVDRISNALALAKYVSISGVGEPMIADCFDQMLQLSDTSISFFSNGQVLTDKKLDLIFSNKVQLINFSLDAATNETYRKIRGFTSTTFDIVKNNIKKIVARKGLKQFPEIVLIMVVMKENYRELPAFVDLAHELGANGVQYWQMRTPSTRYDYTDHYRYDFHFSYTEQAELPPDFDQIIQNASDKAAGYQINFREN